MQINPVIYQYRSYKCIYRGAAAKFMAYLSKRPGGRLNKKDGLTRYGDSHVKDKTS